MEIPDRLKGLYKHWSKHTLAQVKYDEKVLIDLEVLESIRQFAIERMLVWERKESGKSAPFTKDPILHKQRFCNIYRELDRQTIETHLLLESLLSTPSVWLLNLMYCRLACNPITVKNTGLLNFNENENLKVYQRLIEHPRPKYGTAYVFPINAIAKTGFPTREEFFCLYLPKLARKLWAEIEQFNETSVNTALERILPLLGVNLKFHMTEVLIDVAYQFPEKINLHKDFHIGPGAIPTLKLLSHSADPDALLNYLATIELEDFPYLTYNGVGVALSAENWEGIACEYRKYCNYKAGRGRSRLYIQPQQG
ncbi:MAG: putative DNA base hypermodification protein [Candidatus Dojkabacteria bacterium]|nr:MAG: putative DNA base hypermodification protein [Candidatus Dojkabacteria bacterium]